MAAKVINFHSPDGKNTYELTFTRESAEATERNGFQIYEFSNGINPVKNTKALFYGAFIARNKSIKRKLALPLMKSRQNLKSCFRSSLELQPVLQHGQLVMPFLLLLKKSKAKVL